MNFYIKIKIVLSRVDTILLVAIPLSIGWLALLISYYINLHYPEWSAPNLLIPLGFLIISLSGVSMIARKEIPPFKIYGWLAVLYGITWVIFSLVLSFLFFYGILVKLCSH